MPAELSSGAAVGKLAGDVVARFGRFDALVHVMGGFAGGKSVPETDDATLEKMLDLNYRAAFYMARAVLPHMRQQGSGRILAVASRQGVEPAAMVGAYSASKAARVALIRTIALENKDRSISANTVLPGTMDTSGNRVGDLHADGSQWVQPSQVAALRGLPRRLSSQHTYTAKTGSSFRSPVWRIPGSGRRCWAGNC